MTNGAPAQRRVSICLVGLAAALIVVGMSSGTLLRHGVQIAPIVVALAVMARHPRGGAYGALPIFAIWTVLVVLIWLYVLGIARVVTGSFSPTELVCTVVIAGCSLAGAGSCITLARPFRLAQVVTGLALFALQVAALWVSFLGPIAHR